MCADGKGGESCGRREPADSNLCVFVAWPTDAEYWLTLFTGRGGRNCQRGPAQIGVERCDLQRHSLPH